MIPVYEEFYNTVLDCLKDNREHIVADINNYCVKKHNITDEDKKLVYGSSGVNIVYARVHWALTYLKMAKLIDNVKRGMYKITEEGIKASKDAGINNKYLEKYDSFKDFKNRIGKSKDANNVLLEDSQQSPEEKMDDAYNEFKEKLIAEIIDKLLHITPTAFEHLVNELLSKMGYGKAENTSQSGDGGIDGIIKGDKFGFDRIYVQAKRWALDKKISSQDIDAFSGAMNKFASSTKGVYITTSSFSQPALKSISQNKNQQIIPIDGRKLAEYMIDYDMGVEKQQEYIIKKIDTDFFEDMEE